jgi:predicted DNA-binding transcriptional regulator AlpA
MPVDAQSALRDKSRQHQKSCQRRPIPKKHKYVYILGSTKKETKSLKKLFAELNPEKNGLPYPKIRGPQKLSAVNSEVGPLTIVSETVRPIGRYLNVKAVAEMYGISIWTIYELIKTDPTFPYRNIGIKKKLLVNTEELEIWMEKRTKKERQIEMQIPSADDLLRNRRRYA